MSYYRDATISHGQPQAVLPVITPSFPLAAQPEIIRASQKDAYYLHEVRELLEPVLRNILGTRWLHKWTDEVTLSSRLLYFSLTTFLGTQTLGEEYTDIFQYVKSNKRLPTARRRATLLLLHLLAPYAFQQVYTRIRGVSRNLRQLRAEHPNWSIEALPLYQRFLASIDLPDFQTIVEDMVKPVHLAIFYLTGKYYSVAKRFTQTSYLSSQPPSQSEPPSYEVLGAMMIIQIVVRASMALYKRRKEARERAAQLSKSEEKLVDEKEAIEKQKAQRKVVLVDGVPLSKMLFDPENPSTVEEEDAQFDEDYNQAGDATPQERRCTLCLGTRRSPTSTECGHVFCWECIVGWAREKNECPLCRQSISTLSQLLPLYNV